VDTNKGESDIVGNARFDCELYRILFVINVILVEDEEDDDGENARDTVAVLMSKIVLTTFMKQHESLFMIDDDDDDDIVINVVGQTVCTIGYSLASFPARLYVQS